MVLLILSFTFYIVDVFAEEYSMEVWVVDGIDYRSLTLFIGDQQLLDSNCPEKGAQGCWLNPASHKIEEIYILTGKDGSMPNYGGCSVLWHELLHAMGYDHEWMFKNLPNKDCSYSYIHRNDWIEEKYGR